MARLSLDDAQAVISAATAKAKEIGVPMTIAIVDEAGYPVLIARMDGAAYGTAQLALAIAETATALRMPGQTLAKFAHDPWFMSFALKTGRTALAGQSGILIKQGGGIVGAIGVSGGSGAQDRQCAVAGLAAIGIDLPE